LGEGRGADESDRELSCSAGLFEAAVEQAAGNVGTPVFGGMIFASFRHFRHPPALRAVPSHARAIPAVRAPAATRGDGRFFGQAVGRYRAEGACAAAGRVTVRDSS
jgi:hypothetical protein